MRSLPKVLKSGRLIPSDEIYHIRDTSPQPPAGAAGDASPKGEEPAEAAVPAPPAPELLKELEAREEAARQRIERMTREAKEQAEEMAQRVLQNAKTERERLIAEAQADAGRLREQARQQAYQDALTERSAAIEGRLKELDQLMERLSQDQDSFLRQYQEGLLGLSLEIAQKVLDEAVMSDASLMRPLVQKAVASVKNAEWISVEVSSRLPGLVEELKKELAGRPDLPRTDVMGAELPPGGCRVQTPEGILDASVDTQLTNLKNLVENQ